MRGSRLLLRILLACGLIVLAPGAPALARSYLPPTLLEAPAMTVTNTTGYDGRATATRGTYGGGGVTVTDTWQRCTPAGSGCTEIPGATGLTYAIGSADRGYTIRLHEHAGNPGGSLDTYTDAYTDLPSTSLSTATPGDTNQTSATFTLSSSIASAVFECRLDGGAWQACSSTPTFSSLADGSHTLQARAVYAGLSDPAPASYTWTVDTVVPGVSIASAPAGATNQTTAAIAFSSTKPGVSFQCSLDGSAWSPCSSPWSDSGLGLGSHSFGVEAVDQAGNVSSPATASWSVIPPPPLTSPLTTVGIGSAAQSVQLPLPSGGSVTLLEPDGTPSYLVIVPWQGRYSLDTGSGELSFIPVPSFSGRATPVAYEVTDAFGQSSQSTYTPSVISDASLPTSRQPRAVRAVARCASATRRSRHGRRARRRARDRRC